MTKVLVTGSGAPGWYGVYKMLKEIDPAIVVYGTDVASLTSGSSLCKVHKTLPSPDKRLEFLTELQNFVSVNRIDIVLPLTDPELVVLSQAKIEGCKIAVCSYETLLTATNKKLLYEMFPEISPESRIFENTEATLKFIKEVSDGESCYVKIPVAHGSRGTKKVVSEHEWLSGFSKLKPEQFGNTFPLSMLHKLEENLLLVETLPGEEYSIDCVFSDDGKLQFYVVRQRLKIKNGICDTAKFITDDAGEFKAVIEKLQSKLIFSYNVNIQVKRNKKNELKLLEINPRISGSLGSASTVGYNLVEMTINILQGRSNQISDITPKYYNTSIAHRVSNFIG